MRKLMANGVAALLTLGLMACGGQDAGNRTAGGETGDAASAPETATAQADKVPAAFNQCRSCHSVEPGRHMIGPSLAGIFGTPAGDVERYAFSPAMRESGIVWDEKTLDSYLKAPRQTVPGTKMIYPGLKNDAKRAEVIAYLKSLEAPAP